MTELPPTLPEWIYDPPGRLLCMCLVLRRVPREKVAMNKELLMKLIDEDIALIRKHHYPMFHFMLAAKTSLFDLIDQMVAQGILCQFCKKAPRNPRITSIETTMSFADFEVQPELKTKEFMASVPPEVRTFADLLPMSRTGLLERIAEQA
jgi:hypothetical protein